MNPENLRCFLVSTLRGLDEVADELMGHHTSGRIFAFYGEMGAGKTAFIKAICRRLGVAREVQSPTFALVNEYVTGEALPVYHFDFYRIKKSSEALDIGFEEYLDSGGYCFIEWPEMVEELLPSDTVKVLISPEESTPGHRRICF